MGTSTQVRLTGPTLVRSDAITDADANSTVAAIDVPANSIIPPHGVWVEVVTAFAGGTPSLDVGDGDDVDGWVDTTAITETSTGSYADVDAAYAVTGKLYTSADTLDVVVATGATAGCAYVMALIYDVSDEPLTAV